MDNEALESFAMYQQAKNLSPTTIRNRSSILRGLARRSGKPLLAITLHDLRAHVGRPGISAGTRRTERGAFVAFFDFLVDDEYRADNPALKLARVEVPKGEPRPFSIEQIDAMLSSGAYTRTRAMILLGYYQGFRVSSIARVHGHDIDLLSRKIRTIGKGNKPRALPLHPVVAELAGTMPSDGYWFPARGGKSGHVSGASVTNLITRAKKRAGITDPHLTPHSLRHAFGSHLVEEDVDIRVVQELMMHESVGTTQIYTRVSERRKRAGLSALPTRAIPARSGRGQIAA